MSKEISIMVLYAIFIAPLETFLGHVLTFLFSVTHSYGMSILLMSVIVNTLLIPVYFLAERLQTKEYHVRKKMQSKIDEFALAFQGMNRFMYMKTLYRIHQYHPIMGVRALGSLLVQVPFFIAAYQFLSHCEVLQGVRFLFVSNLKNPDGLISFGHLTINVLPFVMTAVNVMSAHAYTKRKNPDALIQTWGLALVFLVLLYNASSALVLYWTVNNIYSWAKNSVLLLKQDTTTIASTSTTLGILRRKVDVFFGNHKQLNTIMLGTELLIGYLLLVYVLFVNNRTRGIVPNNILLVVGVLAVIQLLLMLGVFFRYYSNRRRWHYVVIGIVAVGVSMCMGILLYNVFTPLTSITKYYVFRKLFLILILLGLHAILFPYAKAYCNTGNTVHPQGSSRNVSLSFLGIVICSALMASMVSFLVVPTEIYNSDPKEIAKPLLDIQKPLLVMAVVWMLGMITAYGITPRKYKVYIAGIICTISVVVFAYAYVLPFDYGTIDRFRLMNPNVINATAVQYFLEGVGLTLLFLLMLRILRSQPKTLFAVLSLGLVFVTIKFVVAERYYVARSSVVLDTVRGDTVNTQVKDSMNSELLSFSKDGKNIVVLLLDMFNGGLMQPALKEHPSLETSYDGFVWYPNSLSISTYTTTSKPSMMAGWRYTPGNIATAPGDNLAEKVENAYNDMFDVYQNQDYHVATSGVSYYGGDNVQCETLEQRNITCLGYWDRSFISYWQSTHPLQSVAVKDAAFTTLQRAQLLMAVGFMRILPFAFKRYVYKDGSWHVYDKVRFKNQEAYNSAIGSWAFLDSFATVSNVNNKQNTLKYFHMDFTHTPYALDTQCLLQIDEFPDTKVDNNYGGNAAYYSAKCSLLAIETWLTWLKDNGIYDNTKIIIVSDHGYDRIDDPMNTNHVSLNMKLIGGGEERAFTQSHVLLMVKDFDDRGGLRIDDRLMSNADVPSIMCDGLKECGMLQPSPTASYPEQNRMIPIYNTGIYDWSQLVKQDKFYIFHAYEVTSDMFIPENWHKIQ